MSFLKDFKEELSQAVNELVNIDESEMVKKNDNNEEDEMARKRKKNDASKLETEVLNKEENLTNAEVEEKDNTVANIDMAVLNELFNNDNELSSEEDVDKLVEEIKSDIDEEEVETMINDDVEIDNINIDEFLNDEEESEKSSDNEVIKELARNIKNKMNDDKLEEMMMEDKESKKAALRGNKVEEEIYKYDDKEETALATEEIAEITKGTMLEGNIVSEGSMNIYGKIKGNVSCRGKLVVCGTIVGASRGAEIFTNNAKIDGDVTSDGSIKIGNGTVIIGNVYGTSAVIAGAIKGDIDINGPVIIDCTAVVQGNIRSRSVQINNGAAIEGMVSQCYAEIDYAALFDKTFAQ